MSDHSSSVYNNTCLKVPKKSNTERFNQKFLSELHNEVTKNFNDRMKADLMKSPRGDVRMFIDFFDSIPEYDDVNHLSNKDFYRKLENLKEKQRVFCQRMNNELKFATKDTTCIDDFKNRHTDYKNSSAVDNENPRVFCGTPTPKKSSQERYLPDENLSLSDMMLSKPPSRRSVRIETPSMNSSPELTSKHHHPPHKWQNMLLENRKHLNHDWDELVNDDLNSVEKTPLPLETRSAPNSPTRTRKCSLEEYDGITVPRPFKMTVRDEENKIVDELLLKIKGKEEKPHLFKAHDVPIESQIPLFDKIMEDQHKRSQKVKQKRKADLQAQMRPFSFTRRDEEIQELTKTFSKSLPCVYYDDIPVKVKKFRAKPIPRNLFSNYIYKKMHEDEFYRALQKKVRAEEMLKQASLPPSMAKREHSRSKIDVCPRSYRELYSSEERDTPIKKHRHNYKKQKRRVPSAVSRNSTESRTPSSLDMSSINRSNLAAVLRIQSAKKRIEMDITRKLEEAKLKEEAIWREKLMRKKSVWQALAYSHEEDLAMRLQQRRDEEKLRNEEHRLRMELMLGRVNQQPTLFERQSQIKFSKPLERNDCNEEYKSLKKNNRKPRSKSMSSGFSDAKSVTNKTMIEKNSLQSAKHSIKEST
ncbi:unnamed protein product [Ceutorhynchus assimilis]|uniref:Protein FAM161B n=1 Tax=Ceutorhynchus assimilis TaxID=467358 RepID=A0A9P0DKD9_9CUCU|nr:unnamed protein product [Ceutorhynchus assimilis]